MNRRNLSINNNIRPYIGGLWILAGASFFSEMNAVAKVVPHAGQAAIGVGAQPIVISALQITFARYMAATVLLLPLVLLRRQHLKIQSPTRYLVRTVAGFGGIALMFTAVRSIPLAAATGIGFTSPIFAMFFAAFFLGDRISRLRWFAAAVGLIGALIVATPGSGVLQFGGLLALAAAVCMGAEIVGVKWLAQTSDSNVALLFFSNLTGAVLAGAVALPGLVMPSRLQALMLFAVGALAVVGQACVVQAARLAEASFLAPFFYVSLIYAALLGYLIFGETVSSTALFGCLAILISAGALMASNRRRQPLAPPMSDREPVLDVIRDPAR